MEYLQILQEVAKNITAECPTYQPSKQPIYHLEDPLLTTMMSTEFDGEKIVKWYEDYSDVRKQILKEHGFSVSKTMIVVDGDRSTKSPGLLIKPVCDPTTTSPQMMTSTQFKELAQDHSKLLRYFLTKPFAVYMDGTQMFFKYRFVDKWFRADWVDKELDSIPNIRYDANESMLYIWL